MSMIQYTDYIEEECCEDCDYAGGYNVMGNGKPVQICPDCGGQLVTTIGRWMYTENKSWWRDYLVGFPLAPTYYGFLKGRNTYPVPPPPPADNNYTLEGSLAAYKAGHPKKP